jgi:hypothetical protein
MGWAAHEGEKRAGSRPVRPSQVSQRVDIVSRLAMQIKILRRSSRPFVGAVLAASLALRSTAADNQADAEPRVIEPGPPPSDAIVLFDGKDLSQWQSVNGGEIIAANKLDEFAASLPHRQVPITETWTSPFWRQPAVSLFPLLCFVAEWGLRRWKGLS